MREMIVTLFTAVRTSKGIQKWLLIGGVAIAAIAIALFLYRGFYSEPTVKGMVISEEHVYLENANPRIALVLKEYPNKQFAFEEQKYSDVRELNGLLGLTVELTFDPASKYELTKTGDGGETIDVMQYEVTALKVISKTH
ncbi:MAG: hypothetical protein ABSD21_09205 [Rhizomicrobium sp.]|jgi:hypothetical protein